MTTKGACVLVACATALVSAFAQEGEQRGPVQPIPFSHKHHAGTLKLQCKMCHPSPDPGEAMTIAPPSTCMQCHSSIKTDSPHIQRLAEAAKSGKPIPWVRVYRIPEWVFFSHKAHTEKQATCQQCHGPVAERVSLFRESDLSMGGCMACHAEKRASTACTFCHEPR